MENEQKIRKDDDKELTTLTLLRGGKLEIGRELRMSAVSDSELERGGDQCFVLLGKGKGNCLFCKTLFCFVQFLSFPFLSSS